MTEKQLLIILLFAMFVIGVVGGMELEKALISSMVNSYTDSLEDYYKNSCICIGDTPQYPKPLFNISFLVNTSPKIVSGERDSERVPLVPNP